MTFSSERPRSGALAAFALLLALPGCDALVDPEPAAPDRLVFISQRDGATGESGSSLWEIYSIAEDGTDARNLTRLPAQSYRHLRLSPDGSTIVFYSDRSGCFNVWTMRTDGSSVVQLTGHDPGDRCNIFPHWSPDGSRIQFTSSRNPVEQGWDAYVMNADGSNVVNVSNNAGTGEVRSDFGHGWTPDGRVVFHDQVSGEPVRTYVVDADGGNLQPLLDAGDRSPYWSPDGSRIAFMSERDGSLDLFVTDAHGTDLVKVAGGDAVEAFSGADPWSPDGSRLAFASNRDGNWEIYVVDADGSNLARITNDPADDAFRGWTPDGTRLLLVSDRSGNRDVFIVDADGTNLRQVTRDPADDGAPLWIGRS